MAQFMIPMVGGLVAPPDGKSFQVRMEGRERGYWETMIPSDQKRLFKAQWMDGRIVQFEIVPEETVDAAREVAAVVIQESELERVVALSDAQAKQEAAERHVPWRGSRDSMNRALAGAKR